LYALFRHNAELIGRGVSSCIPISGKLPFIRNRKRSIQKAKENNLFVKRSFDFKSCMKIFAEVLMKRHEVKPAHTGEEIELLANRFPDNIKLFGSYKNDTMLGGVIVFESKNVAHAQYGANSEEGRELGAEDLAFDYLINDYYKNKKYFDFGISTEKSGRILNEGLIRYKAGFGACPTMYDLYKLQV
jgi:lipid II:glycine glycyltransferase (peptidoglycan interpeptide bridge formation enzyme)